MPISFVGAVGAAANVVTSPTHQPYDFIIQQGFRTANATPPSRPTGTTNFASVGANTCSKRTIGRYAETTTDGIAASTNANQVSQLIFRGVKGFGNISAGAASSNTLSYNTITLMGSSAGWVLAFGAHRTANNVNGWAGTLTLEAAATVGSGPQQAAYQSNGPLASFATQTDGVSASSGWLTTVLELLPYSVFNPYLKSALWTLSSGNTVATQTSAPGTDSLVQCSFPRHDGKYYFTMTASGSVNGGLGIIDQNADENSTIEAQGVVLFDDGTLIALNSSAGSIAGGFVSGDVIGVAVDVPNQLVWFRINTGDWNGSPTANPATGTGGISFAGMASQIFPAVQGSNGSTGAVYTYSGSSTTNMPSGFTQWDGASQTPAAGTAVGLATVAGVGRRLITIAGAGTAAGAATAAGVGASRRAAAGSAVGAATASAVGVTQRRTAGSAVGLAVAAGVGASSNIISAAGTAAGAAVVAGVGRTLRQTAGTAAGAATAAGVGASRRAAAGTAAGVATATGVGRALRRTAGSAVGLATVAGVGRRLITSAAAGLAQGAAAAFAFDARAIHSVVGTALGVATAIGSTDNTVIRSAAGTAVGAATASATTASRRAAAGTAAGAATASGVGRALRRTAGTALGVAVVAGVGRRLVTSAAAGTAVGLATVAGVGASRASAAGTAVGLAIALGETPGGIITPAAGLAAGEAFAFGQTVVPIAKSCNTLEGPVPVRCVRGPQVIREVEAGGCFV